MATALVTIEELGELPPPAPARPRVLLFATALGVVASLMVFGGILAVYLSERAQAIADGGTWLPEGTRIPLTTGNMSLVGFAISCVTMQWAVWATAHEDRRHTWLAFGATLIVGLFHMTGMAFLYNQSGLSADTVPGALVFAVTGAHLVMLGVAMVFAALMAFRTLGGQYSAKDHEGVAAAAVYWYATVAVYVVSWYAVLVTK